MAGTGSHHGPRIVDRTPRGSMRRVSTMRCLKPSLKRRSDHRRRGRCVEAPDRYRRTQAIATAGGLQWPSGRCPGDRLGGGWQSVTIRRIAEHIECSPPVIYEHFASKDDMLYALMRQGYAEHLQAVEAGSHRTRFGWRNGGRTGTDDRWSRREEEGEAAGTLSRTGGLWEEGRGWYIVDRETNGRLAETGVPCRSRRHAQDRRRVARKCGRTITKVCRAAVPHRAAASSSRTEQPHPDGSTGPDDRCREDPSCVHSLYRTAVVLYAFRETQPELLRSRPRSDIATQVRIGVACAPCPGRGRRQSVSATLALW